MKEGLTFTIRCLDLHGSLPCLTYIFLLLLQLPLSSCTCVSMALTAWLPPPTLPRQPHSLEGAALVPCTCEAFTPRVHLSPSIDLSNLTVVGLYTRNGFVTTVIKEIYES